MKLSIIIPNLPIEDHDELLHSSMLMLNNQIKLDWGPGESEIIILNVGTAPINVSKYKNIKEMVKQLPAKGTPGEIMDIGVKVSSGEFLMFLPLGYTLYSIVTLHYLGRYLYDYLENDKNVDFYTCPVSYELSDNLLNESDAKFVVGRLLKRNSIIAKSIRFASWPMPNPAIYFDNYSAEANLLGKVLEVSILLCIFTPTHTLSPDVWMKDYITNETRSKLVTAIDIRNSTAASIIRMAYNVLNMENERAKWEASLAISRALADAMVCYNNFKEVLRSIIASSLKEKDREVLMSFLNSLLEG